MRQQYQVPVCQNLPADPIDAHVVKAFLDALSPVEDWTCTTRRWPPCSRRTSSVQQAQQQQLQRLRYQARLAERQYNQADPDNRLVSRRTGEALGSGAAGTEGGGREIRPTAATQPAAEALSPEEREAFLQAGRKIPELWRQERLSPQQKKAWARSRVGGYGGVKVRCRNSKGMKML